MNNTDLLLFSLSPLSFFAFVILPAIFVFFFSLRSACSPTGTEPALKVRNNRRPSVPSPNYN